MARQKTIFTCEQCGAKQPKWQGQCPECGQWNSLVESISIEPPKKQNSKVPPAEPASLAQIASSVLSRIPSGMAELDRPLGGGIVPGSAILLGGDPGIGKSTLTLQLAAKIPANMRILYISGEESLNQIKLRAQRLGIKNSNVSFLNHTSTDTIVATIQANVPDLVILDSIQAISTPDLNSAAGSVGQIRESAARLINLIKKLDVALVLIGHVTKQGAIAGPKILEHMVDTVLYLEGDPLHHYRILRASKNRFGSLGEIGLFEMQSQGLMEVHDPTGLFVSQDSAPNSGSIRSIAIEGSRALAIEVQALTVPSGFGYPKRTSSGIPLNRLQLLIAVLTRRANLKLQEHDVYANIVGGYQTRETAVDLPVCLAIASSLQDRPVDPHTVAIGEVSLSGTIRPVLQPHLRIKEAEKLGFSKLLLPKAQSDKIERSNKSMEIIPIASIFDALKHLD